MRRIFMKSTHSDKLERWLGKDEIDRISSSMKGWYGPPIGVANIPGSKVYATADGDFIGNISQGSMMNLFEYQIDRFKRVFNRWNRRQLHQFGMGFTSLSDLIAEATAGKRQEIAFQKTGTTGVVSATNSLWRVGNQPAAGSAAAAAPGGTVPTSATTGALRFNNPTGGDTTHFTGAGVVSSVSAQTLLMYDRIFAVAKTMNSTATEAVTGVPTRYQSTTAGAADSAEGNFLFVECGTALPATAHNWTICQYTDQSGNTLVSLPSLTGNSSNIINRLDHPTGQWFAPLATGDTGIKALTQMQCSATVATGAIDFVIGHPIAWMPCPIINFLSLVDGVNTAFSLTRIFDSACLAFLEIYKSATTATTYSGTISMVSG